MHKKIQVPFLYFSHFGSFGINAKDTDFIFGISHTHTEIDKHKHMHIHRHTQI